MPKWHFPASKSTKGIFVTKDINSQSHGMIMIFLKLDQDILVLSIKSKFGKVPVEIT